MIRVEEARQRILDVVSPLGLERVHLLDALDRVAGEDVRAERALPPWDHSAMDGYALRARDTRGASPDHPVWLEVTEEIPAGSAPTRRIGPRQAGRIMTGAPLPAGADAVVRMEDTAPEGSVVAVRAEAVKGQQIRRQGSDLGVGDAVLALGDIVRPGEIGLLASLGRSSLLVRQRPLVAIVATGSELAEIDEPPLPARIVASNSYALTAMVKACGAIPLRIGIARDRREELAAAFAAAGRADLIVSAGGVSVGDYDLVKGIMEETGNALLFWQVAMSPGRPLAFGRLGQVPIAALPGSPVAAMVCFEQFVRPALLKMMGHRNLFRRTVEARLCETIEKKRGSCHFMRARVSRGPDGCLVAATWREPSAVIRSMAGANGLIVIPEEATAVCAGDPVTVQLLDDSLDHCPEPGY
jgi:molybdopterin molybdotransferase